MFKYFELFAAVLRQEIAEQLSTEYRCVCTN